jgi:dipeptidyl-peptidase-3
VLYDIEITNGLIIQLSKVKLPEGGYIRDKSGKVTNKIKLSEAHMRNRQLLANWIFEHGSVDESIIQVKQNKKTYFKINNYKKCRKLFGELLQEIQRIKSQGDRVAGEELVAKYGTWIDPDLHEEAVNRFKKYNMAPFSAFIQPELKHNNTTGDIEITYPTSFINQMLHYADVYSTLPDFN